MRQQKNASVKPIVWKNIVKAFVVEEEEEEDLINIKEKILLDLINLETIVLILNVVDVETQGHKRSVSCKAGKYN